jgi:hypothetical protein
MVLGVTNDISGAISRKSIELNGIKIETTSFTPLYGKNT